MAFDPGFGIRSTRDPLGFAFDADTAGPVVEKRRLEDIRRSLMQPDCDGPDVVYAIAMDTGKRADMPRMIERNLLFGAVTYAVGRLGREPIRSQGHIHAVSRSCGRSTCELYEIWEGSACIYMQETADDDPGRCFAVLAGPGDVVLVPPGWAHCTISADPGEQLTFGAWCVRDYGFEYAQVRAHGGLAWFPVMTDRIEFEPNGRYRSRPCVIKSPRRYEEFGIETGKPIYAQFQENPDRLLFVSRPQLAADARGRSKWDGFVP